MWVTNFNDDSISLINTNTNTVDGGASGAEDGPFGIAPDPGYRFVFVTNQNDNTVSVIDIVTIGVVDTIPVGVTPWGIAYDPNHHRMYVTNSEDDTVSVINLC